MKMRAFDALAAQLWAIDEAWLELMASISLGEGEGPEAVAAKLGRPLQNAQESTVRDGVAIHPVIGPLFRYANLFTMVSGATSIEVLARDFGAAEANPEVRRHLLEVNSPGGQADGVNELAKMIAGARKPVVAYVGGMAASGGYWIASAADQVVIDETAQLGSIGVVMQIEKSKRPGDDSFEIVSSRSPRKRIDPRTDEGRAEILSRIDAIADVFIVAVADYRGVSIEHVGAEFGGGGIVVGAKAISAGMADTLGSFESTLAQLAGGYEPRRRRKMTNISISEEDLGKRIEAARSEARTAGVEEGRKLTSDAEAKATDAGKKQGLEEGAKAERERIAAIDAATLPGQEKLAVSAKADGISVDEFNRRQIAAEKGEREQRLEVLRKDGKETARVQAAPTATGEAAKTTVDDQRPLDERCKAKWDADANLREEFGTLESYVAYEKNRSKVRILEHRERVAS